MPRPRAHGNGTKRDAILAAAVELLLAQGYDGTSMDAVAAAAGVSKTTVYAHFSDKAQLFNAVMAHAASMLAPDIAEGLAGVGETDHVRRLAIVLFEVVRAATAPELIAYFRVLIAEHDRRRELRGVIEGARAEGGAPDVTTLVAPFIEAVANERGVELVDPSQWVIVLLRLTAPAVQFDMLASDFRPSDELLRIHVELVVRIFVGGALPFEGRAQLPAGYEAYPWGPAFEQG